MPRIVSGFQEHAPDFGALLRGAEQATQRGKEQRAAQMDQLRLGVQIQEAMRKSEEQRAKALEDVNARVQMGDVQARQQQALEAQAANRPPEQKFYDSLVGALPQTTDPKARALLTSQIDQYGKVMQRERQKATAAEEIQGAIADGLIPAPKEGEQDEYTKYLQSGGEPEVVMGRIQKVRQAKTIENMALEKNAESITQMQAMVQAMPAGPERLMAEASLTGYMGNTALHSKPGSGQQALQQVMEDLARGQQALNAKQQKLELEMLQRKKDIAGSQRGKREAYAAQTKNTEDVDAVALRRYGVSPETLDFKGEDVAATPDPHDTSLGATAFGRPPPPEQGGPTAEMRPGSDAAVHTQKGGPGPAERKVRATFDRASKLVEQTRTPEEFMEAARAAGIDVNDPEQFAIVRQALEARRQGAAPRKAGK